MIEEIKHKIINNQFTFKKEVEENSSDSIAVRYYCEIDIKDVGIFYTVVSQFFTNLENYKKAKDLTMEELQRDILKKIQEDKIKELENNYQFYKKENLK